MGSSNWLYRCQTKIRKKVNKCRGQKMDDVEAATVKIPKTKNKLRKLLAFFGPGLLVAIAYIDPGNIDTDLQAGAQLEYMMVWVMLASTAIGFFLQLMSARLGIATGTNLAQACRLSYPPPVNIALWLTTEVAVIASDIPEVIGTAFALYVLFGLKLWIGVVITAADTFLFLLINYFGIRALEVAIGAFVGVISICFVVEMFVAAPPAVEVLEGFIPKLSGDAAYNAVSLLGAVVMPHNLYLHSALVQSRDFGSSDKKKRTAMLYNGIESAMALTLAFIVNFAIIVVAGAKFYPDDPNNPIGLSNASDLLANVFHGKWAAILFGIALLAAGQSSTLTGTYAGQFVMEGFLRLKIAIWKRNLITRLVAIVPSVIIAVIFGSNGSDALVVLSQVILSIQLPYTMIPMLKITSSKERMGVHANSLWFAIIGWICGGIVMLANIYLIGTQIASIVDFSTPLGRLAFAGLSALLVLYFGFFWYLVYLPVDHVRPDVVAEMEEDRLQKQLELEKAKAKEGAEDGADEPTKEQSEASHLINQSDEEPQKGAVN